MTYMLKIKNLVSSKLLFFLVFLLPFTSQAEMSYDINVDGKTYYFFIQKRMHIPLAFNTALNAVRDILAQKNNYCVKCGRLHPFGFFVTNSGHAECYYYVPKIERQDHNSQQITEDTIHNLYHAYETLNQYSFHKNNQKSTIFLNVSSHVQSDIMDIAHIKRNECLPETERLIPPNAIRYPPAKASMATNEFLASDLYCKKIDCIELYDDQSRVQIQEEATTINRDTLKMTLDFIIACITGQVDSVKDMCDKKEININLKFRIVNENHDRGTRYSSILYHFLENKKWMTSEKLKSHPTIASDFFTILKTIFTQTTHPLDLKSLGRSGFNILHLLIKNQQMPQDKKDELMKLILNYDTKTTLFLLTTKNSSGYIPFFYAKSFSAKQTQLATCIELLAQEICSIYNAEPCKVLAEKRESLLQPNPPKLPASSSQSIQQAESSTIPVSDKNNAMSSSDESLLQSNPSELPASSSQSIKQAESSTIQVSDQNNTMSISDEIINTDFNIWDYF